MIDGMTYIYMCVHKFITGITTNCLLGDLIIHAVLLMRGLMWSQPGTYFVLLDITVLVQLRRSLAVVGTSFFLLILICPFICLFNYVHFLSWQKSMQEH